MDKIVLSDRFDVDLIVELDVDLNDFDGIDE